MLPKPVLLTILITSGIFAQDAKFEVASIRPSASGFRGSTFFNPTPERFQFENTTIKGLIAYAYGVREFQIVGASGWVGFDRYDILAKPEGQITDETVGEMVQNLLAERLNLRTHEETKEVPVYGLVAAKGGPRLQPSAAPSEPTARGGYGLLTGQHLTTENLATLLANQVERPVIDKTGLTGQFDLRLHWTPEDSDDTGPSIFTAVQEQLGLKLENQRAPVEIVVIDHIERPSEN